MDMVGHDNIASDCPAVQLQRLCPFLDQDRDDFGVCQYGLPLMGAGGDVKDGLFDPHPCESFEMFVFDHGGCLTSFPGSAAAGELPIPATGTGITDPGYRHLPISG